MPATTTTTTGGTATMNRPTAAQRKAQAELNRIWTRHQRLFAQLVDVQTQLNTAVANLEAITNQSVAGGGNGGAG